MFGGSEGNASRLVPPYRGRWATVALGGGTVNQWEGWEGDPFQDFSWLESEVVGE